MHNYIKPCSNCYRARQFITDGLGRLVRRPATHTQVTTAYGMFLIENRSNTIVGVPLASLNTFIGTRIILDAGHIVDVQSTRKIVSYTVSRKVTMSA